LERVKGNFRPSKDERFANARRQRAILSAAGSNGWMFSMGGGSNASARVDAAWLRRACLSRYIR
jgi:hypothetical protein